MYPEYLVAPMRQELVDAGFQELKSSEEVDSAIPSEGTVFVVVNSVCGCAAANARPAAKFAVENGKNQINWLLFLQVWKKMLLIKHVNICYLTLHPLQQWLYLKMASWYI